jgi:hypothetical protein
VGKFIGSTASEVQRFRPLSIMPGEIISKVIPLRKADV